MKKTILLAAICLSMIALATPFAEGNPAKTTNIQSITLISPQNTTYNTALTAFDVPLEIHIDVPRRAMVTWIGYNLDASASNATISGNTTVTVEYGHHSLVVYATDILGTTYASETVSFTVSILFDVNGDGEVDIDDIVIIAAAYGATPEDPNWKPSADVAYPYGIIDVFDLVSIISSYGSSVP